MAKRGSKLVVLHPNIPSSFTDISFLSKEVLDPVENILDLIPPCPELCPILTDTDRLIWPGPILTRLSALIII